MKVLVAGIGNIFFGDDGFGVEVAQRMARRPQAEGVCVRDLGIRGFDLSLALQDDWDAVVLVDSARRGEPPGTLYVLDPGSASDQPTTLDLHGMDPGRVLSTTRALGDVSATVVIVACEPASFGTFGDDPEDGDDDPMMGLSDPVAAAIEPAIALIGEVIARFASGNPRVARA